MRHVHVLILAIAATLLGGCASSPSGTAMGAGPANPDAAAFLGYHGPRDRSAAAPEPY